MKEFEELRFAQPKFGLNNSLKFIKELNTYLHKNIKFYF